MTAVDITLLIAYSIGVLLNGIVFFSQRHEIKKLKGINSEIEKYFQISVNTLQNLLHLKDEASEQEKKLIIGEMAKKLTADYMEKFGHKKMDKAIKKLQGQLGEQFDEIGWFVSEWLYSLSEDEREHLIKTYFPKSEKLIRANLQLIEDDEDGSEEGEKS